jgi:hypothetical protein
MYVWDAESKIAQGGTTTDCPLEETSCCCNRLAQHHNPITCRYKNAPAPHFAHVFWFFKKVSPKSQQSRKTEWISQEDFAVWKFLLFLYKQESYPFHWDQLTHECLVKHLLQVIIYFSSHVAFQHNPPCCAVLHFMTHVHNRIGDGGCRMQRTK